MIYTAHHDHLGIGEPDKTGDKIYNGAVDNAVGLRAGAGHRARLRGAARAARGARCSSLFVAAEEQGLLGSKYYSLHPTFPPGKIAANINYDGGNICGRTEDLTFIGYGQILARRRREDRWRRSRAATLVPDQFPDRGFFYRSDQFNFAKIGVPAIYLTRHRLTGKPAGWGKQQIEDVGGAHYHQPSDEIDRRLELRRHDRRRPPRLLRRPWIANTDEMPTWNPGRRVRSSEEAGAPASGEMKKVTEPGSPFSPEPCL